MSDDSPTNGKRAAAALDAVSLYARFSAAEGSPEEIFFFDYERDALPGGDQDRLSALLCGLMHYAERRSLSFPDALTAARQEHGRQRTAYLPGNAVRRAGPRWRTPAPGDAPLTGEVIAARPGRPAKYRVDFITSREWLPEPDLAPARPFPAITTSHGTFASAYAARRCLNRVIPEIEHACHDRRTPEPSRVQDLDTILAAMSGWSGLGRQTLLGEFTDVITETDGQLIAGARTGHPVTLAAATAPFPPGAALPGPSSPPGEDAAGAVLPFRKSTRRQQTGRW